MFGLAAYAVVSTVGLSLASKGFLGTYNVFKAGK